MSMSVSALRFWFIKLFMWIPSCGFNMNFQISCRPCNSSLSKSETQKQWLAETRFQHVTCMLKPIISKNAFGIGSGWCNQETTNLWVWVVTSGSMKVCAILINHAKSAKLWQGVRCGSLTRKLTSTGWSQVCHCVARFRTHWLSSSFSLHYLRTCFFARVWARSETDCFSWTSGRSHNKHSMNQHELAFCVALQS